MKLALLKNIACAHYDQLQISEDTVDTIAQNTKNTWQPDRGSGEMHSNTKQGKIAEVIVEEFIRRYYNKQLSTLSYDKIRNDRNEKHAPLICLSGGRGAQISAPSWSRSGQIFQIPGMSLCG